MAENYLDSETHTLAEKEALNHAWNWFSLHAAQRLQCVNYFYISTTFLAAAFVTLLGTDRYFIAFVVSTFGAWSGLCFFQLDLRNKRLVKAAEHALKPLQKKLAKVVGIAQLELSARVELADPFTSYGTMIPALQIPIIGGWFAGALFCLDRSLRGF